MQTVLPSDVGTPYGQAPASSRARCGSRGRTERARALAEAALATVRSESASAQGQGRFRRDACVVQIEDWLAQHVVP